MDISVEQAIQKIKDVGLNVYTPKNKDSDFIKLYRGSISKILPKVSGNAIKVLLALSCELSWDESEVILSVAEIIENTGLERKTVLSCLKELEENLLIKRLGPNIRRSYLLSNCYVRIGKS